MAAQTKVSSLDGVAEALRGLKDDLAQNNSELQDIVGDKDYKELYNIVVGILESYDVIDTFNAEFRKQGVLEEGVKKIVKWVKQQEEQKNHPLEEQKIKKIFFKIIY